MVYWAQIGYTLNLYDTLQPIIYILTFSKFVVRIQSPFPVAKEWNLQYY